VTLKCDDDLEISYLNALNLNHSNYKLDILVLTETTSKLQLNVLLNFF